MNFNSNLKKKVEISIYSSILSDIFPDLGVLIIRFYVCGHRLRGKSIAVGSTNENILKLDSTRLLKIKYDGF